VTFESTHPEVEWRWWIMLLRAKQAPVKPRVFTRESGADLRGARIDNVDFYFVDLREALYDPDQEQRLRRCRAIL
jgi:hypothetical protein